MGTGTIFHSNTISFRSILDGEGGLWGVLFSSIYYITHNRNEVKSYPKLDSIAIVGGTQYSYLL